MAVSWVMDYRELQSALRSKGKAREDRKGDHVHYFLEVDEQEYRATKISHSAKGQISDPILGQICRQMRLTRKELEAFVECPLGRKDWVERFLR